MVRDICSDLAPTCLAARGRGLESTAREQPQVSSSPSQAVFSAFSPPPLVLIYLLPAHEACCRSPSSAKNKLGRRQQGQKQNCSEKEVAAKICQSPKPLWFRKMGVFSLEMQPAFVKMDGAFSLTNSVKETSMNSRAREPPCSSPSSRSRSESPGCFRNLSSKFKNKPQMSHGLVYSLAWLGRITHRCPRIPSAALSRLVGAISGHPCLPGDTWDTSPR